MLYILNAPTVPTVHEYVRRYESYAKGKPGRRNASMIAPVNNLSATKRKKSKDCILYGLGGNVCIIVSDMTFK